MLLSAALVSCGKIEYAEVSSGNLSPDGFVYTLYEDGSAVITGGNVPSDGHLVIPAEVDGHKVKGIGSGAFDSADGFYSLEIKGKPDFIGPYAFSQCGYLAYADLGGVTELQSGAFSGCRNLTSLRGLGSLRKIDSLAFCGCDCLCDFDFPETLTEIGNEAFAGCGALTAVTLPSSLKTFGNGVFRECPSLTYADVSALKSVPDYTFCKCESLALVKTGSKLTSIGTEAFRSCKSLMTVTLPRSLRSIGDSAFAVCDSLTTVNYTGSEAAWKKIDIADANDMIASARPYCGYKEKKLSGKASDYVPVTREFAENGSGTDGLFEFALFTDGTACVTGYKGSDTSVTIPDSLGGYKVTAIGEAAFFENGSLSSVTIGKTVDTLYDAVFYDCKSLSSVNGGGSLTGIGTNAFTGTQWLDAQKNTDFVIFGDGVLIAYNGQSNAAELPAEVKHIGGAAFSGNYALKCVIGGENVVTVAGQAFAWCENLTYFNLPGLKSIGNHAFSGCGLMTCVKLSDTMESLGESAFGDCYALKSVCLGNSMKTLRGTVFNICQNIRTVCVPESMEQIYADAFDSAISVIFLYPGTEEQFRAVCVENSVQRYLSDDLLVTGVR